MFVMKRGNAKCYSDRVIGFHDAVQLATDLVIKTLDKISPRPGHPFVIGDYGTADGVRSYELIRKCIEFLRNKYGNKLPIQIVYEDQATNNFRPIMLRANGLTHGEPGLVKEFQNVFVLVSGTSFYSQCLPPESIDLLFVAYANHWPSMRPGPLSDAVNHTTATGPEREVHEKQAAKDWETFLLLRAAELAPGGFLVSLSPSAEKTTMTMPIRKTYKHMADIWKDMAREGTISQDEFPNINMYGYYRTSDEIGQPFKEAISLVRRAGLRLESISTYERKCQFRERYQIELEKGGSKGALRDLTEKYVDFLRTFTEQSFFQGLATHRSEGRNLEILDTFYQRLVDLVMRNPDEYGHDIVESRVVIRKDVVLDARPLNVNISYNLVIEDAAIDEVTSIDSSK